MHDLKITTIQSRIDSVYYFEYTNATKPQVFISDFSADNKKFLCFRDFTENVFLFLLQKTFSAELINDFIN